jgi:hypothetical protein
MGTEMTLGAPAKVAMLARFDEARSVAARWQLFSALVVLNVLDIVTTELVLRQGGVERNPFVQPIVHDMVQLSLMKAAVLGIVGMLLARASISRIPDVALVGATGWYMAVISWNLGVLALI